MGRMFKDSNPVQLNSICMGQSMKTVAKFSETEKSLSAQTIVNHFQEGRRWELLLLKLFILLFCLREFVAMHEVNDDDDDDVHHLF